MSRGPGRIERVIETIMDAEPDNAFTITDLVTRIFPGEPAAKKHRVMLLRAARTLLQRRPDLTYRHGNGAGSAFILINVQA
jgi:hypothetical protein